MMNEKPKINKKTVLKDIRRKAMKSNEYSKDKKKVRNETYSEFYFRKMKEIREHLANKAKKRKNGDYIQEKNLKDPLTLDEED